MFHWWGRRDGDGPEKGIPEMGHHVSLDSLMEREMVILFKHSPACPVSWAAHAHVTRFRTRNPLVPIYLISVIKERAASLRIAQRINVRHESPQIIVLRRGVVAGVASHGSITEDELTELLTVA